MAGQLVRGLRLAQCSLVTWLRFGLKKGKASMLYTAEKQPATFFGLAISCACLRATKRGVSPSTWPRCRRCCGRRGCPCAAPIGRGRPGKGALALAFDERIQKDLANVL